MVQRIRERVAERAPKLAPEPTPVATDEEIAEVRGLLERCEEHRLTRLRALCNARRKRLGGWNYTARPRGHVEPKAAPNTLSGRRDSWRDLAVQAADEAVGLT